MILDSTPRAFEPSRHSHYNRCLRYLENGICNHKCLTRPISVIQVKDLQASVLADNRLHLEIQDQVLLSYPIILSFYINTSKIIDSSHHFQVILRFQAFLVCHLDLENQRYPSKEAEEDIDP